MLRTFFDDPLNDDYAGMLFQLASPPAKGVKISVIVPVKDEAEHIVKMLDALRNQRNANNEPLDPSFYEVLVLANNCYDHSFDLLQKYQQQYPLFNLHVDEVVLPKPLANIGMVRRILMDEACSRLQKADAADGIIASTDGDTVVDHQWIYHINNEIAQGNDAVGGRILAQGKASVTRIRHLRNVTYRCLLAHAEAKIDPQVHDPWPRHFQYFGASLAVTCKMYKQAGRLPKVPYLEDDAFHNALIRHDAKVRKSFKVKVYTSDRITGRVSVGFSEQLKKWTDEGNASVPHLVEPAGAALKKYCMRRRLRVCYNSYKQTREYNEHELLLIATELHVDKAWLKQQLMSVKHFGNVWEEVERSINSGSWQKQHQPELIVQAIQQLRSFVRDAV